MANGPLSFLAAQMEPEATALIQPDTLSPLAALFGGATAPEARREAAMRAGFGLLARANTPTPGVGTNRFGANLGLAGLELMRGGREAQGRIDAQAALAGADLSDPAAIVGAVQQLIPIAAGGNPNAQQAIGMMLPLLEAIGVDPERLQIDVTESGGERIARDKATGKVLWSAPADEAPAEVRQQRFSEFRAVGNDFVADVKPQQAFSENAAKVFAAPQTEKEATGASDIALINSFQRMIDPAVVREGDVRLLQSAQSISDRIKTWIAGAAEGDKLPPELRRAMLDVARRLIKNQREVFKEKRERARRIADIGGFGQDFMDVYGDYDPFAFVNSGGGGGGAAQPAGSPANESGVNPATAVFDNILGGP